MSTVFVLLIVAVVSAWLTNFFSVLRYRIQLQFDILKETSTYLTTHLVTVAACTNSVTAHEAYAKHAPQSEDLNARVAIFFRAPTRLAFKKANALITPSSLQSADDIQKYREAMFTALLLMAKEMGVDAESWRWFDEARAWLAKRLRSPEA